MKKLMSSFSFIIYDDPIIAIRLFLRQKYVSDTSNNLYYKNTGSFDKPIFTRINRTTWYNDVNEEIKSQYNHLNKELPSSNIVRKAISQLYDKKYIDRINGAEQGFTPSKFIKVK